MYTAEEVPVAFCVYTLRETDDSTLCVQSVWPHVNFLDKGFVYADLQRKGNQNRIFTGGRSDSLEREDVQGIFVSDDSIRRQNISDMT